MTEEVETFICKCWLGNGVVLCDTPKQCGPAVAEPMFEDEPE